MDIETTQDSNEAQPRVGEGLAATPCSALSREMLIEVLRSWHYEWEVLKSERDAKPLNHAHRQIWEGMCNTQMARIADLQDLIQGRIPKCITHEWIKPNSKITEL